MYIEFEKGSKYPKKGADVSYNHESFEDAGWIIDDNDLIVDIDCLSKDSIKVFLTMFNINTQIVWTERGCHLYFKKPSAFRGAKGVCPLGFEIEYKHSKNTKAVTIKRNNVLRTIENKGVRNDLPDCLGNSLRNLPSLLGLGEGDGRNQKLHSHKFKVMRLNDYKNILRFINNHIFSDPLEENEFQTVIRDEEIKAEKDGEQEVAKTLIKKYKIVKMGNSLHYYDGQKYISDESFLINIITEECAGKQTRYVDEVIKQMKYLLKAVDTKKPFDIKLRNGILREGDFINIDSSEFTPYFIDVDYIVDAEPVKIVDDYLDHLTQGDEDYRNLLLEVLAHTLITDPEFKRQLAKFFIFIGNGGNGKGTLLEVIRRILGRNNCSSLSPIQMTNERYVYSLKGKLVNLGDDVESEPINNKQMKMLKNISTCDEIPIRKLFNQAEDITLTTSLIFTSNSLLKTFEKGEAYKRRVMWMPMFGMPKKKDPKFISKLTDDKALEYWIKLIIDGYLRLYENNIFTTSKKIDDYNEEYHQENNGCLLFIQDYDVKYFLDKRPPEVYEVFKIWAEENDVSSTSKMLKEVIMKEFNLTVKAKKKNGKTEKVYVRL